MDYYPASAGLASRTAAAVMTGLVTGSAGISVAIWTENGKIWQTGLLVGALAAGTVWIYLLWTWTQEIQPAPAMTYYPPEPQPQPDPQPTPAAETIRLEIWQPEAQRADFLTLPVSWAAAVQAARLLVRGESFALNSLAGSGKPLSRSEFEALRDNFLGAGFLSWRNPAAPAQGVDLTPAGRAMVRKIAESEIK